jgi:hypothetical protein
VSTRDFYDRAIDWLRAEQQLSTDVTGGAQLEAAGSTRVHGFVGHWKAAARWAMAGLWAVTLGLILMMANLPGFTGQTRATFERAGSFVVGGGVICFAVAEVGRRRHRTRAVVELRDVASGPATSDAIAALHDEARGATAWVVAEGGVAPDALALASKRGDRCFEPAGKRFREADGGDASSTA